MIPLVWVWIWDGRQHRVTHPLLFTNNVWVFNVPQTLLYVQGVVRRVYRQGFFEKTRESNRFQTFYKDNTFYSVKDPECWTRKNLNRSGLPLCRVALTQQPGNIRIFQVNDITECWGDHSQHFVTNLALTRQRSTRRSPRKRGGGGLDKKRSFHKMNLLCISRWHPVRIFSSSLKETK